MYDPSKIKVLIGEDSPVAIQALRVLIARDARMELLGSSANCGEMVKMCKNFKPTVVVMDLSMAPTDPNSAEQIRSCIEEIGGRLVVTSIRTDGKAQRLAANYGATIFVDKSRIVTQLIPAMIKAAQVRHS